MFGALNAFHGDSHSVADRTVAKARKVYLVKIIVHLYVQSAENRRKERNQFWLRLRHAVILISNVRTSASKKINLKASIRTLAKAKPEGVDPNSSDLDFCIRKNEEKFYGFRQTVLKIKYFQFQSRYFPV